VTAPLAKKLQLKPGQQVAVLNAPEGYASLLDPLPEGAERVDPPRPGLDFVQLYVRDAAELARLAPAALGAVKEDGLLWICYPKGGAKAGTDIHRDTLYAKMKEHGLEGVTLVAVDEKWSAMRFRPAGRVGK
jgi:hypothetical protein